MTAAGCDYLTDPDEIYRRSFAAVRAETDLSGLPEAMADVALRVVHACGMPEIVADLALSEGAAEAGRAALAEGAPILVDAEMVAAGIIRRALPRGNRVICALKLPGVPGLARRRSTTRSAAAVELWRPWLEGSVVAIGNAPTALFRLLDRLAEGWPKPALILGFPVGFVGAAEAKDALIVRGHGVPFMALRGRRGGSAMAAAAVNALAGDTP